MQVGEPMVELWRGPLLESVHYGHAVIWGPGGLERSWGNVSEVVYPRSSAKMLQALPLIESGAADVFGLGPEHLALACASHNGAEIHTSRVTRWLDDIGRNVDDLRCGPQEPADISARNGLICAHATPCQIHNNCSGKHAGFLTLAKHLGAGPEYVDHDHPVQRAVREAQERMTGEDTYGYGIDGCSAPNFAFTLAGVARAMARFAAAPESSAEARLFHAMTTHPELVAGEGRACTHLMRAAQGKAALKTGAEGFFVAILPEKQMGVALKIVDGTRRAAECAITAILVQLGVLRADHPTTLGYLNAPIKNWRGLQTGWQRAAPALI